MSIPIHISQYIQDSVNSNISQEERVARIRIITELVHDKIVRLFAASDITVDDLLANQKTIRDGFVTTSRNDDETLVLYQRDSDLYTEDTEEVNELNDVILHLFFSNPNVTTEEYANLVNNFGLRKTTSEDGSIITYILETNLGTVSGNVNTDIVVARQTAEGIENKLNIGQLVYTTGDYEYDPNNASRILDTEIDELLPNVSTRQQLINEFFRLYSELRPPDYPNYDDLDQDGLTDSISEVSSSMFAEQNNISDADFPNDKFITWLAEQEDDENSNKSLQWMYEDLQGFFPQSEVVSPNDDLDGRPEYVDKSSGYLKLRSLNQGIIIRKQEGTDVGLIGNDPTNPAWEQTGLSLTSWVRFLNKEQDGTIINFGNPTGTISPKGFALETFVLREDDIITLPTTGFQGQNSNYNVNGLREAYNANLSSETNTVAEFCNILEQAGLPNPLGDQDAIRVVRLSVRLVDGTYYDSSIPKYGFPKFNQVVHGDIPNRNNENNWAMLTYTQIPIDFNEWFFINGTYDTNIDYEENPLNLFLNIEYNEISENTDQLTEYFCLNNINTDAGPGDRVVPYSGKGNNCIVEFISKSDLLRARGFKVEQ